MLLEINEPAQALEQFEATLKKEPGRFRVLHGAARAAQLRGNRDARQRYFRELLKVVFMLTSLEDPRLLRPIRKRR
jgi:Tfp pilus assembly protein PilF